MDMYTTILTSLDNAIFTITINRPDKLNALNREVMKDLDGALDEVYTNAAIRSVIITGAGPKAFAAGADIGEFSGASVSEGMALARKGQAFCIGWWLRTGHELSFQTRIRQC
ncbi:MAG: hypothetical protein NVSMB63_11300 [Sediminibacterium sp.]